MAPNAACWIAVPHPRSDFFISDPTHVRPITPQVMLLFSKRVCRETLARGWANSPLALELDVDFELEHPVSYVLEASWEAKRSSKQITDEELRIAMQTHWNVVDEIKMTIRKVP
jgi:hypothetical protein